MFLHLFTNAVVSADCSLHQYRLNTTTLGSSLIENRRKTNVNLAEMIPRGLQHVVPRKNFY